MFKKNSEKTTTGESADRQEAYPGCGTGRQKGSGRMSGLNPKIPAGKRQNKGSRNRSERNLSLPLSSSARMIKTRNIRKNKENH